MEPCFTPRESTALYTLFAENASDIIVKTDRKGFVVHALPGIGDQAAAQASLFGRHIVDLVHPAWASRLLSEHEAVLCGHSCRRRFEVLAAAEVAGGGEAGVAGHWFEVRMHELVDEAGRVYGVVSLMRSIAERRALEDRLFAAALTDPLTGLTNRRAFIAMLRHMSEERHDGCVALFAIDYFKAINLRHGQSAGDDVLVAFADMLRTLTRNRDIISRIGGENLAVLLPGTAFAEAKAMCQSVVATLAGIGHDLREFPLTASAGLVEIAGSVDETLNDVELALFMAKVKGGNRVETGGCVAEAVPGFQ